MAVFVTFWCSAAAAELPSARAKSGAPETARVDEFRIAHDPNLPTYVVVVEQRDYSASGQISGGGQAGPLADSMDVASGFQIEVSEDGRSITSRSATAARPNFTEGIKAQLVTALTRCGNIVVADPESVKKLEDGTYTCRLQEGEVGPFIIRGTISEFNETAELTAEGEEASAGGFAGFVDALGSIAGSRPLRSAADVIGSTGGRQRSEQSFRSGSVGMDLKILDGRSARFVESVSCAGTFSTATGSVQSSMMGFSNHKDEFAASALGQATRAAMNDAMVKISSALSRRAR